MAGFRVAVSPDEIRALARRAADLGYHEPRRSRTEEPDAETDRRNHDEYEEVVKAARDLPIARPKGGDTTLGRLLAELKEAVPESVLSSLTAANFFTVSPFAELGRVAVGTSTKGALRPGGLTLRPLLLAWGDQGSDTFPVPGSQTTWIDTSWMWFHVFPIVSVYRAKTAVRAEGLDAASALGGDRAAAAELCRTELTAEEQTSIIGWIRAFACDYATNTPMTAVPAVAIETAVCCCQNCSRDFWNIVICPFAGNHCTDRYGSNVSEVSAEHRDWFYEDTCWDVASLHKVTPSGGYPPIAHQRRSNSAPTHS